MPEARVQLAQFTGSERILFGHAKDFPADFGREGLLRVFDEADFQMGRGARDFDERGVDAVGRGAGHHAEDELCARRHKWLQEIFNTEAESLQGRAKGEESKSERVSPWENWVGTGPNARVLRRSVF